MQNITAQRKIRGLVKEINVQEEGDCHELFMELRKAIAGNFHEGKLMALFELITSRICTSLIHNLLFNLVIIVVCLTLDTCSSCGTIRFHRTQEIDAELRVPVRRHLAESIYSALRPSSTLKMACSRCCILTEFYERVVIKSAPKVLMVIIDRYSST
jgi:hypothetical protein